MIPKPFRLLSKGAAIIFGGFLTLNLAATVAVGALRSVAEKKRKKFAMPCGVCNGKGFYICKLCNGNATIKWSPLYDPIHINPCVCPTCDGNRVQRCLNCIGKAGIIKGSLRPEIPSWCDPAWRSLMERWWSSDPDSRSIFSEIAKELRTMSAAMDVK